MKKKRICILGIRMAFNAGEADLSHILPDPKTEAFVRFLFCIQIFFRKYLKNIFSDVQHAATFELSKDGVTASAATGASIVQLRNRSPCNIPFCAHNSSTQDFSGFMSDPNFGYIFTRKFGQN